MGAHSAWCTQACCCSLALFLPQAEPEPGAPGTATIAVRLPDASVVRRRFDAAADTSAVYAWLSCLEEFPVWEPGTWALVSALGRKWVVNAGGQGLFIFSALITLTLIKSLRLRYYGVQVTAFPRARLPAGGATLAQADVTAGGGALLIVEQL